MGLAELHNDGQITVPIEIRRILKLKDGDKISFVQKDNGEVVVNNSSVENVMELRYSAFKEAQKAFAGEADKIGYTEEQVLEDIMRMRYGENA